MRKWLTFIFTCALLAGCAVTGTHTTGPIAETAEQREPSTLESGVDAQAYRYPPSLDKWRRFVQITSRPLERWSTEDFKELLALSNRDLDIDLEAHLGGRNFIFGIIGSSISFPNGSYALRRSDYTMGHLKYASDSADYSERMKPSIVEIGASKRNTLLGANLGGSLRDIMEDFGEAEIEYVIRVGGGVKAQLYFARYTINGLVFLFEVDLGGELTELPPHPPLPTRDEILNSELHNVHVLKEDCALLAELDAQVF